MYPLDIGVVVSTKELWDDLQIGIADLPVRVVLEQAEITEWNSFNEKIERMRPSVLLLDITHLDARLDEVVRRIRDTSAAPLVFALHTAADRDLILKTLRAGASEYLFPPFADHLRQALERISTEKQRKQAPRTGGRIIGFLSAKGGCGATTLACHTAASLGHRTQQKVLLADFDMEAALVGFLMKSKCQYTLMDALKNVHRLDPSYWGALVSNGVPNVDILSGPKPPASARSVTPEQIRYVLRFAKNQYDWIVVDLGRSLNEFSFHALEDIDETHLVTNLEVPALHQAKELLQRLIDSGYGLGRIRLVLNRAPKRSDFTLDDIKSMLGVAVYATVTNDYESLQESYAEGKLLTPNSPAGRQIDDLVSRISGLEPVKKKKLSLFG